MENSKRARHTTVPLEELDNVTLASFAAMVQVLEYNRLMEEARALLDSLPLQRPEVHAILKRVRAEVDCPLIADTMELQSLHERGKMSQEAYEKVQLAMGLFTFEEDEGEEEPKGARENDMADLAKVDSDLLEEYWEEYQKEEEEKKRQVALSIEARKGFKGREHVKIGDKTYGYVVTPIKEGEPGWERYAVRHVKVIKGKPDWNQHKSLVTYGYYHELEIVL